MIENKRSIISTLAASCAVVCVATSLPAFADTGLAGSWSGGGLVNFAGGASEKARCRVTYSKKSATSYQLSGRCATPSGNASQTATVRQRGPNRYAGRFFNSEYNVSGSITVTVNGSRQTVVMTSDQGTGTLSLRR